MSPLEGYYSGYLWEVDEDLAVQVSRFVNAFNALFDDELPMPEPKHAKLYWYACKANDIVGRCVRLGCDDTVSPIRHYHWAICWGTDGEYSVQEFWKSEVWTTERYHSALRGGDRCLEL